MVLLSLCIQNPLLHPDLSSCFLLLKFCRVIINLHSQVQYGSMTRGRVIHAICPPLLPGTNMLIMIFFYMWLTCRIRYVRNGRKQLQVVKHKADDNRSCAANEICVCVALFVEYLLPFIQFIATFQS